MKLTWYFDFISPFAYLQHCQFDRLPDNVEVEYKPILLAGLLNYWENVGPAEIPPKRIFTYKHCYWMAKKNNIAFKMPPAHPFNSLFALRLAIATGCQKQSIQLIFETIWKEGLALDSAQAITRLSRHLGENDLSALTSDQVVKDMLKNNTEAAAADFVFGVPTFTSKSPQKHVFWGFDAFDMLLDFVANPNEFDDQEMQRIEQLPVGVQRPR